MAKEQFIDCKFTKVDIERLNTINSIIEEYLAEGYTLTLRQLYYQLVSRDITPNIQAEYTKLSTLLKNGQMVGIVDWKTIEDRVKVPYIPWSADGASDAVRSVASQFRLDRQLTQKMYLKT